MIEIRPLRPEDDRQSFTSGDVDLGKYTGQNQFRLHIGTTHAAKRRDPGLRDATASAVKSITALHTIPGRGPNR